MARQVRFRIPYLPQHIVQRGHNGVAIFQDAEDYEIYLDCLADAAILTGCEIHAYALLPNRIELLCTPGDEDGVPKLMQAVGRRYVLEFNSIHRRSGTLWDGRYRASLVEPSSPVLTVYRYLDTLASTYGLEERSGEYPWSSHHSHTHCDSSPVVHHHPIYARISPDPARRCERYRELCEVPLNENVKREVVRTVRHGLVLGSESFKDRMAREFSVRVRLGRPGRPPKRALALRILSQQVELRLPSLA